LQPRVGLADPLREETQLEEVKIVEWGAVDLLMDAFLESK
jgi:hypothetical protein